MKISFVFCYNRAWWAVLSPIIAYFEKTPKISHFAIVVNSGFKEPVVYESVWPFTKKSRLSEWLKGHEITVVFEWTVPEKKSYEVYEWLESQVGKYYPFGQLVFILLTIVSSWFSRISRNWVLNGKKWLICTELGSRFIERFFIGHLNESHDRIGIKDMLDASKQYEMFKNIWRE